MKKYVEKMRTTPEGEDLFIRDQETYISSFYDEITYQKKYSNNSQCYIVLIPKNDNDGNIIELVPAATDGLRPSQHAWSMRSTLTFNASYSVNGRDPINIGNGQVLQTNPTGTIPQYMGYIAMDRDRNIFDYNMAGTTAQQMLNNGIVNAFPYFWKIVENAAPYLDQDRIAAGIGLTPEPRQALGVRSDGTIVLFTCDGRNIDSAGMTSDQLTSEMLTLGCVRAWNLDGGGSTATIYKGSRLNMLVDGYSTIERSRNFVVDIVKATTNATIADAEIKAGEAKLNAMQMLIPLINKHPIAIATISDAQTITQSATREAILMPTVTSMRGNVILTGDENSKVNNKYTRINVNNIGDNHWYKITAILQLQSSEAGLKNIWYMRYNIDGQVTSRFYFRYFMPANSTLTVPFVFWDTISDGMQIEIAYSGAANDIITKGQIVIEHIGQ